MNDAKTTTLLGGQTVKVTLLDESIAEFKVRQLLLGDYPIAKRFVDEGDEIGLVAFICGHQKDWANNLAPESYEELYATAEVVNAKGFFAWLPRQQAREDKKQQAALQLVANWSPDQLKEAVKAGMQLQSTSPTGAPRPRP
jgi:hypothetical protein